MAAMCVKTGRVDVAAVCLGNTGNARAAKALREAMRDYPDELEVHLGTLATHLNMLEDAERLLKSSKRPHLLNQFYQASGSWRKAMDLASTKDRVHLRNTYYSYAKYLESIRAYQGAIEYYERADVHRSEVPRMLYESPQQLEAYVSRIKDKHIQRWWAQYTESLGEVEKALQLYIDAGDYLSAVRLYCYTDQLDKACELADSSKDKAAAYHVARQLETNGEYRKAVKYFAKAHAYSGAITLCKEQGLDDLMAQLALMSTEADQIEVARYFEAKPGNADKAVLLYHKAGAFGRALDLAFRTEQFSALDLISNDLSSNSDPRVLERCAEFFLKNQQFDRAVRLLALAKRFDEAIDVFTKKNVAITEQVAETLTPSKDDMPDALARTRLLEKLADCCMEQGHYHVAAKKYTQAGCKEKAMRALMKSNDTAAVLRFANRAGAKEQQIQLMAANYLQSQDWRQYQAAIKKFYVNAKAQENLAGFCEAMAQGEIDDNDDYTKAIDHLRNGIQAITGATGLDAAKVQQRTASMTGCIKAIEKFQEVKTLYDSNPAEALQALQSMTTNKHHMIRSGDVYKMLVLHYAGKQNFSRASEYLDEMRSKIGDKELRRFLEEDIISSVSSNKIPSSNKKDAAEEDAVPEAAALKRKVLKGSDDWLDSV